MKLYKVLIAVTLSSVCLVGIAAEGKWTKGYGQGNLEFFIDKGNARLSLACPSQESNNGGYADVTLLVNNKDVRSFKIQAGEVNLNGPFTTSTRGGENSFISLINNLHKTDAKVTYGTNTFVFPKSNVTSVLPTYMSGKLNCAFN